jgi:hypothetical protein
MHRPTHSCRRIPVNSWRPHLERRCIRGQIRFREHKRSQAAHEIAERIVRNDAGSNFLIVRCQHTVAVCETCGLRQKVPNRYDSGPRFDPKVGLACDVPTPKEFPKIQRSPTHRNVIPARSHLVSAQCQSHGKARTVSPALACVLLRSACCFLHVVGRGLKPATTCSPRSRTKLVKCGFVACPRISRWSVWSAKGRAGRELEGLHRVNPTARW